MSFPGRVGSFAEGTIVRGAGYTVPPLGSVLEIQATALDTVYFIDSLHSKLPRIASCQGQQVV